MAVIDRSGRFLRLVNIIDLLTVLLSVALIAAGFALLLPRTVAGPLTAVVSVGSFIGLVLLSLRRFGVTRGAVREVIPEARPAVSYIWSVWNWFTAEPNLEVIVIDLRETLVVGQIIGAFDRVVIRLDATYRRSDLYRTFTSIADMANSLNEWTRFSKVTALAGRMLAPPESPDEE